MCAAVVEMRPRPRRVVIHADEEDTVAGFRDCLDRVAGDLEGYAGPAVVELDG